MELFMVSVRHTTRVHGPGSQLVVDEVMVVSASEAMVVSASEAM